MKEELIELRNNLLSALEQNDVILAKMYINKLDTLIHKLNNMIKQITPKEKAKEMYIKFSNAANSYIEGKKCALIAVENEYNAKIQAYNEMSEFCPDIAGQAVFYAQKEMEEVKQEIINC